MTEPGGLLLERDFLRIAGTDARTYLQGQVSQDVEKLGPGDSAWSFLLQPQGKVEALVRITCEDADSFLLDTDPGWGGPVDDRLRRFKLRVKADIEALDWTCLVVRGVDTVDVPPGAIAVEPAWRPGVDLIGSGLAVPASLRPMTTDEYEAGRIEHGWPAMGSELDSSTIPAEAGIVDRTVSFTKGCYTGQELVARIDSRGGNVPRHLRSFVLAAVGAAPGARLLDAGGNAVGTLTSVADRLALGYLKRGVEEGALQVEAAAGRIAAVLA